MLKIESLSASYNGKTVLKNIDLSLKTGEMLAVLGPSGSGKSTLLKILTGEKKPDTGRILLNGQPILRQGAFAYMPQSDALMPWRRALSNAALGLEVRGVPRRQARLQAQARFAQFGLQGHENSYPQDLSGGMRQRLALMRTVLQDAPVLLLDEPLGALDALTRLKMQLWLAKMRNQHGWTILMITHDIREAVLLADQIAVFSHRPAALRHLLRPDLPRQRDADTLRLPAAIAAETHLTKLLIEEDK